MRDKNLRSGDLHEELGIFLPTPVALVAPVPRQEDVGRVAVTVQPTTPKTGSAVGASQADD